MIQMIGSENHKFLSPKEFVVLNIDEMDAATIN